MTLMAIRSATAILLLGLILSSCSRAPEPGSGASPTLISTDATRRVAMHVLLNRYPRAEIVSEQNDRHMTKYRFSTNGTLVPTAVVVDRKAGKARFENLDR